MPARRPSPSRRPRPAAARPSLVVSVPAALARGAGRLLVGVLAAAASGVAARPVLFAGSAAFLGISGMVGANAFYGQSGFHPQPMLVTRAVDPAAMRVAIAGSEPPAAQPWRPSNDPRIVPVPLVEDVQALLAEAGYYEAEIDGRPGQATDRAIRTFQAERGLRVDGMATPLLLTQIRQLTSETPSPSARPEGEQYASLDELMSELPTGAIAGTPPEERDLVRRIQSGLAEASVAELSADGILGAKTRAAIRTFQELEGLEVTGEPSSALLSRLESLRDGG